MDTYYLYMIEFKSGRIVHLSFYEVEDMKQYCADEYPNEVIKSIYKEVYYNDGEE